MILITGKFGIIADKRSEFIAFAAALVPHERLQAGCLNFDIFEDVTTPNRFLMLEEWESQEALDAYNDSDEFERNEAAFDAFVMGDPSWDEYQF